jgi:hypothetical protein
MNQFKIFPSIGIARLGDSDSQFYLCAESPDSLGIDFDAAGNETGLQLFKDPTLRLKRQGARFRVFQLDAATNKYLPITDPNVSISWEVYLVNKKGAVTRPANPDEATPPIPLQDDPAGIARKIDPGSKTISGKNQSGVLFNTGRFTATDKLGAAHTDTVFLGELRTDKNGNLIVLGGRGLSKSPANLPLTGFYYFSPGWYDDVSDGYVKATVTVNGVASQAQDAWVIVTPPKYAPQVKAVVTLYDIMEEVAIDSGMLQPPATFSFVNDILPIIDRFRSLAWVNQQSTYTIPFTDQVLADNSAANKNKRNQAAGLIQQIRTLLQGDLPGFFLLTNYQQKKLTNWVNGTFTNDFGSPAPSQLGEGDQLTKTVLDSTVGQRFMPGIEGGIIVQNSNLYIEPFRFISADPATLSPGDITALMALPWQGDFIDCVTNWWPSQRPDGVSTSAGLQQWDRGLNDANGLIANFSKAGFVKPALDAAGNAIQTEQERNPGF